MAKPKRKSKPSRAPKAKKKASKIKVLKKKSAQRAKPRAEEAQGAPRSRSRKSLPRKSSRPKARRLPGKSRPNRPGPKTRKANSRAKPTGKPTIKSAKAGARAPRGQRRRGQGQGRKGRPGRKGKKDAWLIPPELPKEDAETRRTRLKNLIKLGKDRGFLTYAEINDHLPDDLVDAEQIEAIISTFGDMGIQVYDQAPDQEQLLISRRSAAGGHAADEDVEEQAEAALSTVDSEFGRTTDPVRMYMREMGSVELLTREGEIEIAKRIEEGLRHMIQAISACPTTVQRDPRPRRQGGEGRVAHRRGGRRPHRPEREGQLRPEEGRAAAEPRRGRGRADRGGRGRRRKRKRTPRSPRACSSCAARRWRSSPASAACSRSCKRALENKGSQATRITCACATRSPPS